MCIIPNSCIRCRSLPTTKAVHKVECKGAGKKAVLRDEPFAVSIKWLINRRKCTMDMAAINSSKSILEIGPKFGVMTDVVGKSVTSLWQLHILCIEGRGGENKLDLSKISVIKLLLKRTCEQLVLLTVILSHLIFGIFHQHA